MKQINKESGYALIGVLLIFSLLAILGMSLTTLSITSVKNSTIEHNNQSAFYIAEAGLNYQLNQIKQEINHAQINTREELANKIDQLKSINEPEQINFDPINNLDTYALFDIKPLVRTEDTHEYEITSYGHIGKQLRTVNQTFKINWNDYKLDENLLPPFAVFTSGQFLMKNGTIHGDIGTESTEQGAITFLKGGPNFNGDIYVTNGDKNIVSHLSNALAPHIKPLDKKWTVPELPEFPIFPNLPYHPNKNIHLAGNKSQEEIIEQSKAFKNITIQSNLTLTLDIGHTDKKVIVDHLNLQNGHIKIKGTGNLDLYVNEKITMGSGSTINAMGAIDQLNIFLKASKPNNQTFTLSGNQKVYGSLYAESANIKLTASGGFKGNLFTGGEHVEVTGGSKNLAQLFFAPNATVEFTGGGTLNGKIISKEFNINGAGTVNFDSELDNYITGPISAEALGKKNDSSENDNSSDQTDQDVITIEKTGPLHEVTE